MMAVVGLAAASAGCVRGGKGAVCGLVCYDGAPDSDWSIALREPSFLPPAVRPCPRPTYGSASTRRARGSSMGSALRRTRRGEFNLETPNIPRSDDGEENYFLVEKRG